MYNLDKITTRRRPIYQQLAQYYYFCEQIRGMTPSTMQDKIYVLNHFLKHTGLHDLRKISNVVVFRWIEYQKQCNNSSRSINVRLAHLKAMLRWQREQGLKMPKLQLNLIIKLHEPPCRKVYFSHTEIMRALQYADSRAWLFIHLAFDCGLRISELQNLRVLDINHDRLTIIGKGQKRRFAFLSPEVKTRLDAWIKQNRLENYLWPSPLHPGQPLAICTIRRSMCEAFTMAGLDNFCPHDLRHSYATDLKQLGVPTRKIQAGLGHNSEHTTERYLSDLEGCDLREIYQIKYARRSVENSK